MSGLSPIKLNKEMAAFLSHSSARMNSCCWVSKMEWQTTKTGRVAAGCQLPDEAASSDRQLHGLFIPGFNQSQ